MPKGTPSRVGALTAATLKTGELVFLLADSSIPVRLNELPFRMTIRKKETATTAGK